MFLAFMLSMEAQQNIVRWIRQSMRSNKIRQTHHYQAIKVRRQHIHHQCTPHTSPEPIVIFSHIHPLSPNRSKTRHTFIFPMLTHRHVSVTIFFYFHLFCFCYYDCLRKKKYAMRPFVISILVFDLSISFGNITRAISRTHSTVDQLIQYTQ